MNTIFVASTSFLNPRHKSWQQLSDVSHVGFSEYGDLKSIVAEENLEKTVIGVFFHDDIQDSFTGMRCAEENSDYLASLLMLIETRCRKSRSPLVFCYSFFEEYDAVRDAKNISMKQRSKQSFVDSLNRLKEDYDFLFTIDIDKCVMSIGALRAFDQRAWYFAKSRLTNEGLATIIHSVSLILQRYRLAPHKVLVLDCDNTLWGGVVGEDGISGLAIGTDGIGKVFTDFQKVILNLKNEGVLLAISSKNNVEDVWRVFDEHEAMLLKRSDIVAAKIDWNEKSSNILDLARELDLNVSSFVFWDDNPVEREKTRLVVPEMLTVDVPNNVNDWPSLLQNIFEFARYSITEEDKKKTDQYAARQQFIESRNHAVDEGSFLKGLCLEGELLQLAEGNISRAVQLCQKTNQFNLTTRRFFADDLKRFSLEDAEFCMLARLKDRFSDHGIVALYCMRSLDKRTILIENILLSCRVLGRQFEFWIMSKILEIARSRGYTEIFALFADSGKNIVAKEYLTHCGFERIELRDLPREKLGTSFHDDLEVFTRNTDELKHFFADAYEN
jgi:FkbH-like protein